MVKDVTAHEYGLQQILHIQSTQEEGDIVIDGEGRKHGNQHHSHHHHRQQGLSGAVDIQNMLVKVPIDAHLKYGDTKESATRAK